MTTYLNERDGERELAAIVRQLTDQVAAGEPIDAERMLQTHREFADELQEIIPTLAAVAAAAARSASPQDAVEPQAQRELDPLGDFQILREIGRGGMGVVYEALQLSLGRRVALKVLPYAGMFDERYLARFQNEARAAASLHHPHVVPVYFVGSERGVNFYAMQLIDGVSVAAMIGALRDADEDNNAAASAEASTCREAAALEPTSTWRTDRQARRGDYYRTVAAAAIAAAEAIDHAHQLGVLHRDVKPGNLLVDRSGKLWVTDFGLARLEGDGGLSVTGDLAGTLRYLPPEVVRAQRPAVDHRADVYSLGATLYEMLALRPAFEEQDRAKLLHQILIDDPTPLREIDPAIPPELETIVQRAMEKRPDDRFPSAQAMADELQRFLDHLPLQTKPPGLAARAGKWCRRHPAVVAAGAAATLVAVLALVALVGMLTYNQNQLAATVAAERAQRLRADANLRTAKAAVDEWYVRFAESWLEDQPGLTVEQRDLLEKAVDFYAQYAAAQAEADFRRDRAVTFDRLAEVQAKLGDLDAAERSIAEAIPVAQQLSNESPGDLDARLLLADCLQTSAELHGHREEFEREYALRTQALAELKQLPAEVRGTAPWRRAVAQLHRNLGSCAPRLGRFSDADAFTAQATAAIEKLLQETPEDRELQQERMLCLLYQVVTRFQWDSPFTITPELREGFSRAETVQLYRQVVAAATDWLNREPRSVAARKNYRNVTQIAGSLLPDDEAEHALLQSLEFMQELRAEFPELSSHYSRFVGLAYHLLERFYSRHGRDAEALEAARRDIANRGENLPGTYRVEGDILVRLKRYEEAKVSFNRSIELLETVIARSAADEIGHTSNGESLEEDLAAVHEKLANVLDELGDAAAATAHRDAAAKFRGP